MIFFRRTSLVILLCLFIAHVAESQPTYSTKNKRAIELYVEADNYRVRGQFAEAISYLNEALSRDKNFFEAYFRLGAVYRMQRQNELSIQNFEQGLALTRDPRWQKLFAYELAEMYLRIPDYEKSLKYSVFYIGNEVGAKPKVAQAMLWKKSAEFSLANRKEVNFVQGPLTDTVNRFRMQYFPVLTADEQELIFTRRVSHTDDADEDLVVSRKQNGKWTEPASISAKINSPYNEGTCTISADGRQLIFTSCQGRRGMGSCDLFESRKVGDDWTTPVNMGPQINSPAWESQPSLSADGRILYFVSDRRGGIGGRDLYRAFKIDENKWGKAENMGKIINTPFDEISPFVHVSGRTLFFATMGRPGFGGFDIFRTEWADSTWTEPVNFGYPINNHEDQFSLFITADGEHGYYSHEENDQYSTSKIYEFKVPEEFGLKFKSNVVKGVVRDRVSKKPIAAHIELINLESKEQVNLVKSDSISGQYLIVLTQGADYALYVNAKGYLFQNLHFNYELNYNPEPLVIDVDLDAIKAGASIVLNNIFFDHNQFDLKPRSITELDKIAGFLNENTNLKVEISGHTDNTGTETYNATLSQKRAQAVAEYLVGKGVNSSRMTRTGYGSKKPMVPNDTEENRQRNRRIEFKLLN
ncbi:MAG: OmpA family protein [Bacteroidota bacterium]